EYVHFVVPGISIPQKYLKRMEGLDGPEGEKEGIRIAREIIDRVRPLAAGILLNPPEGRLHILEHIL
ncbi:MAG: bifunctional homocysteine S-methyltransferase/methylenetetrahydrofolate reductase, partial [Candidatus Aminicenantes bacterium]|nr:bifunctional homocysteine S-methyltransferase/methylenetetrahydrofolate reductase [Candidatus Aminicenantes bacterium]